MVLLKDVLSILLYYKDIIKMRKDKTSFSTFVIAWVISLWGRMYRCGDDEI